MFRMQRYGLYSRFSPVGHMIKDSETPVWLGLTRVGQNILRLFTNNLWFKLQDLCYLCYTRLFLSQISKSFIRKSSYFNHNCQTPTISTTYLTQPKLGLTWKCLSQHHCATQTKCSNIANFIGWFLWPSKTWHKCQGNFYPENICPGNICPVLSTQKL